jgi:hypothetical protein
VISRPLRRAPTADQLKGRGHEDNEVINRHFPVLIEARHEPAPRQCLWPDRERVPRREHVGSQLVAGVQNTAISASGRSTFQWTRLARQPA